MAANKTLPDDIEPVVAGESDEALNEAIDNLRGVLKTDKEGGLPELGSDFTSDSGSDLDSDFGGDLGSDFGGDLDGGDPLSAFGGDTGFGGDFGGDDLGGDFGEPAFGGQITGSTSTSGSALSANLDLIMDIPIDLQIILGSSRMQVSGLMNLTEGATIALDRKIGEPVDIVVNGRLIARGEITVMENDETRFGVKLIEVKTMPKA